MRFRPRRSLTIAGWSFLWLVFFWAFLLVGFPAETARTWLSERLGQGFDARVSIDELHIAWNLDVRLKGVSIAKPASEAGPAPAGESKRLGNGFMVRLDSVTVDPKLSGLMSVDPTMDFRADTAAGGTVSGSYRSGELTLSFRNLSSRDVTISTVPVPSSATMSGSGRLRFVTTNGTIETEIDGVPGGKQRLKLIGGAGPGLDGTLKITVSLPKLSFRALWHDVSPAGRLMSPLALPLQSVARSPELERTHHGRPRIRDRRVRCGIGCSSS